MAERVESQWFGDWIGYSAAATGATVLLILANPITGYPRSIAAAALVAAMLPAYWFLARPSRVGLRANASRAWVYVAVGTVAYLAAYGLNNWANVGLFVLSPQFFLILSPLPAAIMIVIVNIGGLTVRWALGDLATGDLASTLGLTLLVIAVSIYFSNRITSVTQESRERGLLIERLRAQQREIAQLSEQQGAAAERERIAREMHDTLAQGFTSIITLGHAVQTELDTDPALARRHIELITDTAQENLTESRRIIAALTPARLEDSTLEQALGRVAARFEAESGIPVTFAATGEPRQASPTAEVVGLRVFQEALANVRKHSGARQVIATLDYRPEAFVVSIEDDGGGFDPRTPTAGYGIEGMRARVRDIGGTFEIDSGTGVGTRLRITVPTPYPNSQSRNGEST